VLLVLAAVAFSFGLVRAVASEIPALEGRTFADRHLHASRIARDYENLLLRLHRGRAAGKPPQLAVELSGEAGQSAGAFSARAKVTEGSASVYCTPGADRR
jgi:hypothetical protein